MQALEDQEKDDKPKKGPLEEIQELFSGVGLGWLPMAVLTVLAISLTIVTVRVAQMVFAAMADR